MGTRGLTCVYLDGAYKVAQYGQWDHYPSGQGIVALEFCRDVLVKPKKLEAFKARVTACRAVSDDEMQAANVRAGMKPGERFVDMGVVKRFEEEFPFINRDHGAKVLTLIAKSKGAPALKLEPEFARDSLFCEYAYVIDLDAGTFEVFKGFNQTPLASNERFFHDVLPGEQGYHPVKLLAKYKLSELPTDDGLKKDCDDE